MRIEPLLRPFLLKLEGNGRYNSSALFGSFRITYFSCSMGSNGIQWGQKFRKTYKNMDSHKKKTFLMGSGGFGGSRTLPNTMRTHMDTSWTGYTLSKYFPAVVSAIMWGGGSRKIECLVTSHIHCFAGLFYSEPPRKVSADEQMFHITFNLLLNKVNRPLFKTRIVGIIYFIICRLTLFQLQQHLINC